MLLLYILNIIITPIKWALRPLYREWLIAFPTTQQRVATASIFATVCGIAIYYLLEYHILPAIELRYWVMTYAEVYAAVEAVEEGDYVGEAVEYFRVWRLVCRTPAHILEQLTGDLADVVRIEREIMKEGTNVNVQYQTARAYMVFDAGTLASFFTQTTLTREFSHQEIFEIIPGFHQFSHLNYRGVNLVAYWFAFSQSVCGPDGIAFMLEHCPAQILKHMPFPTLPEGSLLPGRERVVDYWAGQIAGASTPGDVIRILWECPYSWTCSLPFEGGLIIPIYVFQDGELFVDVLQRIYECESFDEVKRIIWVLMEEGEKYKNASTATTKTEKPGMVPWLMSFIR